MSLAVAWAFFVGIGLSRVRTNIEDVRPWLPSNTPERREYDWFVETFGSDDMVVLSWDGCRLDDPRLEKLTAALREEEPIFIREVVSPNETVERIVDEARLPRDAAIERLQGFLVGPDKETSCLVVYLTTAGMQNRREAVQAIITRSLEECALDSDSLHLGGRPYLGFYTSRLTLNSLLRLSIPVVVLSTLLAWAALKRISVLLVTLSSAGCAALTAVAVVPWAGYELSGLLAALPSLVYVIATSGTVHLVNYADELAQSPSWRSPTATVASRSRALVKRALLPCLLSSASTGLGTLSLTWSQFSAIRDFGIFGTIGIGITFLVHLAVVPPLLSLDHLTPSRANEERRLVRWLTAVLDGVVRHRVAVIALTLSSALVLGWPLFGLQARFQISELFKPESEFLRHARWLEEHIGPVDVTEVVLKCDRTEESGVLQIVERVQQVEGAIAQIDGVKASHSAATMMPEMSGFQSVLRRMMARAVLRRRREKLSEGSLVVEERQASYWRITLRTSLFDDVDRRRLRRQILETVDRESAGWSNRPDVLVTGATQVFEESKELVLQDFIQSLLLAYVLILALMILALRSVVAGLLAMIPNVVPNVVVFGGLGWLDGAVDMGMTIAACIALGIAVDDTSHMLMSYRRHRVASPRGPALRIAFRHCGLAMCQTSLICGVAMTPYLWAELIYLSRFGLVIPVMMAAALVGDLLLLPALLTGRTGDCFDKGLGPKVELSPQDG